MPPDTVRPDILQGRCSHLAHYQRQLGVQQVQHLLHARLSECGKSPQVGPANTHSARAQGQSFEDIAAAAKTAVALTCMEDSSVSPTGATVGFNFNPTNYVTSVQISNTCAEPWIVIRTRNTGASPNLIISLDGYIADGTTPITWNCHLVAGETRHLPGSCRGGHL